MGSVPAVPPGAPPSGGRSGQHGGGGGCRCAGHAVLGTLALAHNDLPLGEVEILDAQAQTLHQAEAAAIEQLCHQLVGAVECSEHQARLGAGQDGREASGLPGAGSVDRLGEGLVEHLSVQEEQRAERLVLGRGGDMLLDGEVTQEGLDLGHAQISGVALAVEEDIAPDPANVGLFGAD